MHRENKRGLGAPIWAQNFQVLLAVAEYTFEAEQVVVSVSVTPLGHLQNLASIPRVGLELALAARLSRMIPGLHNRV